MGTHISPNLLEEILGPMRGALWSHPQTKRPFWLPFFSRLWFIV